MSTQGPQEPLPHQVELAHTAPETLSTSSGQKRPSPGVRFCAIDDVHVVDRYEHHADLSDDESEQPGNLESIQHSSALAYTRSPLPARKDMMHRFGAAILLLAAVVPLLHSTSFFAHALPPVSGVAIPSNAPRHGHAVLDRRADSPTDVCFRWAQQSAIVNGTLYLYGGQASTVPLQTENTWDNYFLSLNLSTTWQIASPKLTGLPQPSAQLPNVSLGYLWNSHESLFLYGGEFSSAPPVSPTAFSTWEYDISTSSWIEHTNPLTSSGVSAPSNGDAVQRSAEGAGVTVPALGRGFYFGGHEDGYTTEGWSQSIARIYLQSLLEYTFPGYTNDQVTSLANNQLAGDAGVYRNITEGGLQADAGFTARADGLLIYVPGFGDQGILLALAGGTNATFTQMNVIDVYDIGDSAWYTQATSGPIPEIRVNPCAVIAAAADGSSYNIYMFGGQNLIPAGNQTEYNDMWILTLPTFTWIKVDQGGQVPYGRSGHTCNIWDAQMVVVGGYTGSEELSCETPGIYVFDCSALEWVNQFTSTVSEKSNPFNQQPEQLYSSTSAGGLEGSYGYEVPDAVISVIGGSKSGGATLTTPVNTATAGPLATGKAITYTVTGADGSITTSTSVPSSGSGSSSSGSNDGHGAKIGAIVAGCVAGFFFLLACYLAFCAYIYRKQLQLYKRHVEMSQAQARGEKVSAIPGLLATNVSSAHGGRTPTTPSDPSYRQGFTRLGPSNSHASGSQNSRKESGSVAGGGTPAAGSSGNAGYNSVRRSSEISDTNDLMAGKEPTFVGVMLNPRRSLRVINRD